MALVAVLVESDEEVGLVAGRQDVAVAHADLEDRRTSRDRGRDGHVRHDLLITAAGEAREESADGLDTVLGISGEADDDVVERTNLPGSAWLARVFSGVGADHDRIGVGFPEPASGSGPSQNNATRWPTDVGGKPPSATA